MTVTDDSVLACETCSVPLTEVLPVFTGPDKLLVPPTTVKELVPEICTLPATVRAPPSVVDPVPSNVNE